MKTGKNTIVLLVCIALPSLIPAGEKINDNPASDLRYEKDFEGQKWALTLWKDGERPYPKELAKRELWYKEKHGEQWKGKRYRWGRPTILEHSILSPGIWAYEIYWMEDMKKHYGKGPGGWTSPNPQVFSAGGGESVTDMYLITPYGFIHFDPATKKSQYFGLDKAKEFPVDPVTKKAPKIPLQGLIDGLEDKARVGSAETIFGNFPTFDPISGRLYFLNISKKGKHYRYIEKLLAYKNKDGEELLLPAIAEYATIAKQLNLTPVMKEGKRTKPRFAIRTTPVSGSLFGGNKHWGRRILLSPDGKSMYVKKNWKNKSEFGGVHQIEIDTGKDLGAAHPINKKIPTIAQDAHFGICSHFDKNIYTLRHTGCTGGPGALFSFDPGTGKRTTLYDSTLPWDSKQSKWPKGYRKLINKLQSTGDGPADAATLMFITTCHQTQSPRTGAIINGGWDHSGVRRYHDGFVTSLLSTVQMVKKGSPGGRPEFGKKWVADIGSRALCAISPRGDLYMSDSKQTARIFNTKSAEDKKARRSVRIARIYRTDWPEKQPVNGYANQLIPQKKRDQMMLDYVKNYIENYAELSKIY